VAAAVAGPAAAAEAAAAAAACPAAVGAAGADAAAFAVTVDAAAAGAAVGAGFCVQSSCLALSSGAARKHELLLLPCRQASQMLKREGKGREGKGREGKGREGTAVWRQVHKQPSVYTRLPRDQAKFENSCHFESVQSGVWSQL
jgi:hypothetical protein